MTGMGVWMLVVWLSIVVGFLSAVAMVEVTHQRRHPEQHPRRPTDDRVRRRLTLHHPDRRSSP